MYTIRWLALQVLHNLHLQVDMHLPEPGAGGMAVPAARSEGRGRSSAALEVSAAEGDQPVQVTRPPWSSADTRTPGWKSTSASAPAAASPWRADSAAAGPFSTTWVGVRQAAGTNQLAGNLNLSFLTTQARHCRPRNLELIRNRLNSELGTKASRREGVGLV